MKASSSDNPKYTIVPIVEGQGEGKAVPILIGRWLKFRRFHNFEVELKGPVRASGKGSLTVEHKEGDDLGVEYFVRIAGRSRPDAILVLLDADKDCPAILGRSLLARARSVVSSDFPIGFVVANREYEAWFLAAFRLPSFRRKLAAANFALTRLPLPTDLDVESIPGCKSKIAEWIGVDRYDPTDHQARLTEFLPFTAAMRRGSRSFRKLLDELERLTAAARARRGR